MVTISRLARTSVLALLAATLTTAAYAGGGGHSGSNGSGSSSVHGSSFTHSTTVRSTRIRSSTVRSKKTVVSKHDGKMLPNGSVALAGRHPSPHNDPPIVRDHRGSDDEIGNTVGGPCYGGCVGQGGLNGGAQPAQNQDHSTGSGTPKVTDHRTGG